MRGREGGICQWILGGVASRRRGTFADFVVEVCGDVDGLVGGVIDRGQIEGAGDGGLPSMDGWKKCCLLVLRPSWEGDGGRQTFVFLWCVSQDYTFEGGI